MTSRNLDKIKWRIREYQPDITDDVLDVAAPTMLLRNGYVEDMARSVPFSPEWDEASMRITECDVILARFGLV
jgi:hypothetical protein